jgi:ribosomal protein L4
MKLPNNLRERILIKIRTLLLKSDWNNFNYDNKVESVLSTMESELKDVVIISAEEYENLKRDHKNLQALEAAGVDNWEGYDFVMEDA